MVCDYRVQDVALGGQGAPLVPIGDRMLFNNYDFCLNLGGFSNISFEKNGERIAYDICPVNTVLNYYAEKLGYDYDENGKIAASGKIIPELLNTLNELDYYKTKYPKSLGIEYVNNIVIPHIDKSNADIKDILCTCTVHIAVQIAATIITQKPRGSVLITGGGAYNTFLIETIKNMLPTIVCTIPDTNTIEYKESLVFALLGVLKLRMEDNVLSSYTGAKQNHSSGIILYPK